MSTNNPWIKCDTVDTEFDSYGDLGSPLDGLCWFDPQHPPPVEPVLLTVGGVACATVGNITTITAQKKAGKSAFLSGLMAACIAESGGDTLGVRAKNPDRKSVLYFDTEQSEGDHFQLGQTVLTRAKLTNCAYFKSLSLRSLPVAERFLVIQRAARRLAKKGRGVFIIVIDGYADLVHNVNDAVETAKFVADLLALASECRSHVVGVLHLNPGSDIKSRGHLGSELERKSQTNLRIEKNSEISCVWAEHNRGAPIPKEIGPHFRWSSEARMHLSIAIDRKDKPEKKTLDVKTAFQQAFKASGKESLPYNMLIKAIISVSGNTSKSTAERIFRSAKTAGHIIKNADGEWRIMQ